MPSFETPDTLAVTLRLGVGNVQITASDRTDTTVDVRPTDASDASDVEAAGRVRVDFLNGVLEVLGPKAPVFDFSRRTRSVDVTIGLPSGSELAGEVQVGDLRGTGRLGECRFKTSTGNVSLERTGSLRIDTAAGHIAAEDVDGNAEIKTGSGKVRLGAVDGSATVRNSNGDTTIDAVSGDVHVRAANGDIAVEHAGATVEAKTSNGSIRVGEVARGSVELGTAMGDLEVGIAAGTAARLDVDTGYGQVRNLLEPAAGPERSDETVEVRAHTAFGAITIRRSA